MFHIVCPTKYRRVVLSGEVDEALKDICLEISNRYEINFLEIGADRNHVHFLIQLVPAYSTTKAVRIIKSITAREIFKRFPEIRRKLWGGEFWSKGFFASTVGKHGDEKKLRSYVKNQSKSSDYKVLHRGQLTILAEGYFN